MPRRLKMVKVKLNCSRHGPGGETVNQVAGDIIEVDEREALALVGSGQGEIIDKRTATAGPPETPEG